MHDAVTITLALKLGDDTFECTGPRHDVRDFLFVWLAARRASTDPSAQAQIDALTARTKTSTDALAADIAKATPTT